MVTVSPVDFIAAIGDAPHPDSTEPLNWPYSLRPSRSGQTQAADGAYPITLDGIGFLVDLKSGQFRRRMVDVNRSLRNPRGGESMSVPPEVWRRLHETWHYGAGQDVSDDEGSIPGRYRQSMGIDPWTKYQISLLNDTELVMPSTVDKPGLMVVHWRWVVVGQGSTLKWIDTTLHPGDEDFIVDQPFTGGDIVSLTTDGYGVIAVVSGTDTASIVSATSPTESVTYTVQVPTGGDSSTLANVTKLSFVTYANGFLIAGSENRLLDITAIHGAPAGNVAATLIYQHPIPTFRWVDGASGHNAAYVLGGTGDKWGVYQTKVDAQSGSVSLGPATLAADLPDGEIARSLGSYMGYVFIGTNKGMRFSIAGNSGELTFGPIIPTKGGVFCFEGQDRFVWYGNPNPDDTHTGLGRVDLSVFTRDLTPAYANDLMAADTQGLVTGVVTVVSTNRRWFFVQGSGVWAETGNKVPYGGLTQGRAQFGTVEDKTGLFIRIRTKPLNGVVDVVATLDDSHTRVIGAHDRPNSTISPKMDMDGAQFVSCDLGMVLVRHETNPTLGPVVTMSEIRAIPVPGMTAEWVVPIVIADAYELSGSTHLRSVANDVAHLVDIVETGRTFVYSEGNQGWVVHGVDYEFTPLKLSNVDGWQGTFTIRLREMSR